MIRVGFSYRNGNVLSKLIRKLTHSKTSHTWLLVDDSVLGSQIVIEASLAGFACVDYDYFKKKNQIVAVVEPKYSLDQGLKKIAKDLGEPYDYVGLFGQLVVIVGKWFRRKWHNPFVSKKSMFCSEAITMVLQGSDYPGAKLMVPSDTSPQDLLDFLTK